MDIARGSERMFPHTQAVPGVCWFCPAVVNRSTLLSPPSTLRPAVIYFGAAHSSGWSVPPVPGLLDAPHHCSSLPCRLFLPNLSWQRGKSIPACLGITQPSLAAGHPQWVSVPSLCNRSRGRPSPLPRLRAGQLLGFLCCCPSRTAPPLVGTGLG